MGNDISLSLVTGEGSPDIGECIYCGSPVNLSDEHTIPFALWGTHTIKNGSCELCAKATSRLECEILRGTLGQIREYFSSPSRRARKKAYRAGVVSMEDDAGEKLEVDIGDALQFTVVPWFSFIPRRVRGDFKGKAHRNIKAQFLTFKHTVADELIGLNSPPVKFNIKSWSRFLAKIAYGEYIRVFDPCFRDRAISEFIVSGKGDQTNYVGGRPEGPKAKALFVVLHFALKTPNQTFAIMSYVRLFPFVQAPSYLVHLGSVKSRDSLPAELFVHDKWDKTTIWPNYADEILLTGVPDRANWSSLRY